MPTQPSPTETLRSYAGLATLGWFVFVIGALSVGLALQAGVSRGVSWCMIGGFTAVCIALWSQASRVDHVELHPDPFRAGVGFDRSSALVTV